MKKLIAICLLMATTFVVGAQDSKKIFLVFETESAHTQKYENGKDVWKSAIPNKNYVRIVIAPFVVPSNINSNTFGTQIMQQIANFIVKNHLDKFEKMKLHRRNYSFADVNYTDETYKRYVEDCTDCRFQYDKMIIDGFQFNPNLIIKQFPTAEMKQLNTLLSGNENYW